MKTQLILQNQHTYQLKPAIKKAREQAESVPNPVENVSFVKTSEKGIELAKKLQNEFTSTIYDQPNFKTSKAIGTYMAINNQQRRSDIESLIGVNVYA
ncbi:MULTISPECIES: hypothetical protein [Pseudoalteromonas]|uniref:Uncharacterized protein n=1 Tax=Pseudoalteromonas amylolytica TaxID=1859457 RepID=A0A1S1N0P5_9GAMM|nr:MULTISPECIES: hypothetical protein [Pseudoalteromonas]MCF6434409.1 hypothetical protein [Pseudoalteromonas sp. MMG022]OHU85448.1 hypothetical protein BFC16_19045 [Pseudoalteromonas sp. JW3]OHU92931.1 hypothetical protein BET10_02670 [Pseudoalteromonas amylolytica]